LIAEYERKGFVLAFVVFVCILFGLSWVYPFLGCCVELLFVCLVVKGGEMVASDMLSPIRGSCGFVVRFVYYVFCCEKGNGL
jgi:hypothetical protein